MYVLVAFLTTTIDGNIVTGRVMFISTKVGALRAALAVHQPTVWRLHDGNGWIDGSSEAWQKINSITDPCMAQILY